LGKWIEVARGLSTFAPPNKGRGPLRACAALKRAGKAAYLAPRSGRMEHAMKPIFLQIKTEPGKAYDVAAMIADMEIASEIYSTSGQYDLLAKIYVEDGKDIGRLIADLATRVPHIRDTYTIITHRVF
jgi:DNA-binding Lrp family transcriptional regulator